MPYQTLSVTAFNRAVILSAARNWRFAADSGAAIQPSLYQALNRYGCGILAPSFDSLMQLYERCLGRLFGTGGPGVTKISADERRLLECLDSLNDANPACVKFVEASPLASTFNIALRSTRIMIGLALQRTDSVGFIHQRWLKRDAGLGDARRDICIGDLHHVGAV